MKFCLPEAVIGVRVTRGVGLKPWTMFGYGRSVLVPVEAAR